MRKMISLLLALAVVFSLALTVSAVDDPPTSGSHVDGPVSIPKVYVKNDDATVVSPDATFSFNISAGAKLTQGSDELTYVTDSTLGNVAASVPLTTGTFTAEYAADGIALPPVTTGKTPVGNANVRNVVLPLGEFTAVGCYYYTITENASNIAGVAHHPTPIILKVTVLNADPNADGTANLAKVRVAAFHFENPYADSTGKQKLGEITNTYTANKLTVQKNVTGNLGEQERDFSITVTFDGDGKTIGAPITYGLDGAAGTTEVTIPAGKTNLELTFNLKHNHTITFYNVPDGIKYSVSETPLDDYKTAYLVTTLDVNEDPAGDTITEDGTAIAGEVFDGTNGEKVIITNRKESTVDTGIILDSAPYILILAIVVIGLAVVVTRKRANRDY